MNLYSASKYLNYKLFSLHSKGHGIHSPFVFDLITKVFRNKISSDIVLHIEGIRKRMLSDHRILKVTDFGSGSEHMKSNSRKISDIVKYSAVPKKYGILLTLFASKFGHQGIIEFGTSLGISTMYLASGSGDSKVYTIEGCAATAAVAREYFNYSGLENIDIFNGTFAEMLPVIKARGFTPGLVYIDGDHREEAVKHYFCSLAEFAGMDTAIIIDDIHSSAEMGKAWEWIKRDRRVSITIDIFRMGLVFFREGVTHSDYVIRY